LSSFVASTDAEIEALIVVQGLSTLPGPYRAFLSLVGGGGPALGDLFPGETVAVRSLLDSGGPSWWGELLGGPAGPPLFGLRPVFLEHQGYQVLMLDGTHDDAPVVSIAEGGFVEPVADSFIAWLDDLIEVSDRNAQARAASGPPTMGSPTPSAAAQWAAMSPEFAAMQRAGSAEPYATQQRERRAAVRDTARRRLDELLENEPDLNVRRSVEALSDAVVEASAEIALEHGTELQVAAVLDVAVSAAKAAVRHADDATARHLIWKAAGSLLAELYSGNQGTAAPAGDI
jgi:hypothetical protein